MQAGLRGLPARSILVVLALALAAQVTPTAVAVEPPLPPVATSACGLVTDPVCWTKTFACHVAKNESGGRCLDPRWREAPTVPAPNADLGPPLKCVNRGVIVQVTVLGTNSYCEGGKCTNEGVYLAVGATRSCHGSGHTVACVGDTCATGIPAE